MEYTWLLFDADDTLFDYPRAEANALRRTFESFGQTYHPEYLELYAAFNRRVWAEFERRETTPQDLRLKRFHLLFDEIHSSLDPETFSPRYLENLALASDLLPGAAQVLQALSGRVHIALVTNGLKDVQRPRLERSAIRPFIEKVFISEEIGAAKPDPAFFEAVFQDIGRPPKNRILIIGDSLTSDMQGGVTCGIHTCWYNPAGKTTDLPVTFQITLLDQLLAIIESSPRPM
jgi:2-haloacid dehalogenase